MPAGLVWRNRTSSRTALHDRSNPQHDYRGGPGGRNLGARRFRRRYRRPDAEDAASAACRLSNPVLGCLNGATWRGFRPFRTRSFPASTSAANALGSGDIVDQVLRTLPLAAGAAPPPPAPLPPPSAVAATQPPIGASPAPSPVVAAPTPLARSRRCAGTTIRGSAAGRTAEARVACVTSRRGHARQQRHRRSAASGSAGFHDCGLMAGSVCRWQFGRRMDAWRHRRQLHQFPDRNDVGLRDHRQLGGSASACSAAARSAISDRSTSIWDRLFR